MLPRIFWRIPAEIHAPPLFRNAHLVQLGIAELNRLIAFAAAYQIIGSRQPKRVLTLRTFPIFQGVRFTSDFDYNSTMESKRKNWTYHVSWSYKEADEYDIEQQISMTPEERQEIAGELKRRCYGDDVSDIREVDRPVL